MRALLPVVAENNVAKFRDYLNSETVEWVKEFIMCVCGAGLACADGLVGKR